MKTPIAAQTLAVSYGRLMALLRSGKLAPPAKDTSGDFVWTADDLARARAALGIDLRRVRSLPEVRSQCSTPMRMA
jgi:hypothetical protein